MVPMLATDSLAAFAGPTLADDSLAVSVGRADTSVAVVATAAANDPLAATLARRDSVTTFPPARVRGWQVGLLRPDRMQHASFSFALTAALIVVTRNRAASAATAFAFGIGKELWDQRTSAFDPVDLSADAVGVALASVLVPPH